MKTKKIVLAFFVANIVAGCGSDQANRISSGQPSAPPRQDKASRPALAAGLEAMQGRVLRQVDAYTDIVSTAESRYFMHPDMDKDALMEFDVSNLSSLTLSPWMSELQGDCLGDPEAGKVEMSYALDGKSPSRFQVDRDYDELLVVDLTESNTMTIMVNQGNGVITCDWFGLGFLNVRAG